MVLTVSFVLSPVIGLCCHRRRRGSADLTPASGRQDHTTSPSASAPFVSDTARTPAPALRNPSQMRKTHMQRWLKSVMPGDIGSLPFVSALERWILAVGLFLFMISLLPEAKLSSVSHDMFIVRT